MDEIYVLDRAIDFKLLNCDYSKTVLPISADAITGLPADFPRERIISLIDIVDQKELTSLVRLSTSSIFNEIAHQPNCPYYKIKQILDVIAEKKIIVKRIALLPGVKKFVGINGSWFSVESDNSENLRIAAELMDHFPGFKKVSVVRQPYLRLFFRSSLKKLYRIAAGLKVASKSSKQKVELGVGNTSYGTSIQFENKSEVVKIDLSKLFFLSLKKFNLRNTLSLFLYDYPIFVGGRPKSEWLHLEVTVCREILKRAARLQKVVDACFLDEKMPKMFFSVNWGSLVDQAIVRGLRKQGVPIVSMQHACVGHDDWTASQYIDWWDANYKIVANDNVAKHLLKIEKNFLKCSRYVFAKIPMFSRPRKSNKDWDGRSILYILTGFTRNNTMYDNRRINDALYLSSVLADIKLLKDQFLVKFRTHPYDARQYKDSVAHFITKIFDIPRSNSFEDEDIGNSLVIIDSPSTILADVVMGGIPLVLVNRTAKLSDVFVAAATRYNILFDDMESLIDYLDKVPNEKLANDQRRFSEFFFETYCKSDGQVDLFRVLKQISENHYASF